MKDNTYTVVIDTPYVVVTEYKGTNIEEAKKAFFAYDNKKGCKACFFINDERVF